MEYSVVHGLGRLDSMEIGFQISEKILLIIQDRDVRVGFVGYGQDWAWTKKYAAAYADDRKIGVRRSADGRRRTTAARLLR